jgi:outer membrane protein OmpA-like peptidoglycan-associated protein/tetratricopeptide (TPR) repeat protein
MKTTIRAIGILLIMVSFMPASHAQLKKANKLFQLYRYSEAIPLYTKAAAKARNQETEVEATTRLADCYRFTNNVEMASEWYAKVVQFDNIDPGNYLYLGQALQSKGDYENAKLAFNRYAKMVPTDPRGSAYAFACDQSKKWDALPPAFEVRNLVSVNTKWSEFGPVFYKDGIVFTSDRQEKNIEKTAGWTNSNYLDMYLAKKKDADNAFSDMRDATPFSTNINQTYHDGPATFTKDYKTIYLTRTYNDPTKAQDNIKSHLLKIFYAKAEGNGWGEERPFFLNNEQYSVTHPSLSPDGKTLYFSSDMPGGSGASDIWFCTFKIGKWSAPVNLGKEINTFGNEVFPFILNDSTLYFASNGLAGYGGLDVFVSKRVKGVWQTPVNLHKPVNSSYDDFSIVLDASEDHGYFSSNRPGGSGSDDLYACQRLKVTPSDSTKTIAGKEAFFIEGFVKDKNSLLPAGGATVSLLNTNTGVVKILRTDAKGYYKAAVDKNGVYVAKAILPNYISDCLHFPSASDTATRVSAPHDLLLNKLELNKVFALKIIYYDFDKWNIRPDAAAELDKLVKLMKENPISIELASHTDSRGTEQYNLKLTQKRAESVVRYLVEHGIEASRLKAKGYGESKLTNRCKDGVDCTPAEHQANRRTEFTVTEFNAPYVTPRFDMSKLNPGDEIAVSMLDADFFVDCEEPAAPAADNQLANGTKPSERNGLKGKADEKKPKETIKLKFQGISYRVQLYTLSRLLPLNSPEFVNIKDIQYYEENGLYKYTAGDFSTYEQAHTYRDIMVKMGFTDAFVVAFDNGQRITIPSRE